MQERGRKIEQIGFIKIPSRETLLRQVKQVLNDTTFPTAMILEGLSGSGKSFLAKRTQGVIDTIVADGIYSAERSWQSNLNMVVSLTPRELYLLKKETKGGSGRDIKEFIVKGLNPKESLLFLNKTLHLSSLTKEQIVKYSCGLPELLNMFSTLREVTPEAALAIASRYLQTLVLAPGYLKEKDSTAKKYLEMPVLPEILDAAEESAGDLGRQNHIYDGIKTIKERLDFLGGREQFDMNTVIFKDPKFADIYNEALANKKDYETHIGIFVPEIPDEHLQEIAEVLGLGIDRDYFYNDERVGPRMRAFNATERKLTFRLENVQGKVGRSDSENENQLDWLFEPFKGLKKQKTNSLFVYKHEHGSYRLDVISVGWCLESLLQHRDIPYYVDNEMTRKKYHYDHLSKKIVFGGF